MTVTPKDWCRTEAQIRRLKRLHPSWQYGWVSKSHMYRVTIKTDDSHKVVSFGYTLYAALMRAEIKAIGSACNRSLLFQPTPEFTQAIG